MVNKLNPPKKSNDDFIHSLIEATVGSAPAVGSFLSKFFVSVIAPPYEKRTKEWMGAVACKIQEIESSVERFNIENLQNNEQFLDAIYTTTRTAIATSSNIKKDKLLYALQNIALNNSPDMVSSAIFLNFIERFNEAHIIVCNIFESPNDCRKNRSIYEVKETPMELLIEVLHLPNYLIDQIVKELYDSGLITINKDKLGERPSDPMLEENSFLTEFGKQFISFIKKPAF